MSEELEKAIELFCVVLPENKVGTYSPQPNDDARLKEILETALRNNEEVRILHLIDGLKNWHPDIAESDIIECAETAFNRMFEL